MTKREMFPIQDSDPTRSMPVVARALIPRNVLVFFFELTASAAGRRGLPSDIPLRRFLVS